jgi:transketolase
MVSLKELGDIATLLRRDVLEMTSSAGSGHPTSCLSAADILAVLYFHEMAYDAHNPDNLDNDEFILSKGHAAPLLYAALERAGCIQENLLDLRKISSHLEGHPVPASLRWAKVASGSLGQGLGVGVGMALANQLQRRSSRTYVLLGDSECAEGSVWEAAELASYYQLSNLCAIVDVNKLGQRGETMLAYDLPSYKKRFESFGWSAIVIDGHNTTALVKAFDKARASKHPFVILAKTIKGKGIPFLEGKEGWHGRALTHEELAKALSSLKQPMMPSFEIKRPALGKARVSKEVHARPTTTDIEACSTREAYGIALAKLAAYNPLILALDAEVSNSTFAEKVKSRTPSQFIECFIAEQNMISMALGLSKKNHIVFASTFAAFLTRAHDQLRMAALSSPSLVVCGSHCGVSIGEDGGSQMGLEDIALFRSLPKSIVLYPSDAVSTEKLVQLASSLNALVYIRTTRSKTPLVYKDKDTFALNDFKVVKQSQHDSAVLVGAGITLHESLKAYEKLKSQGTSTAVVDCYCLKPFPAEKFLEFVRLHGSRIVVTEDHYNEGGMGEMIASLCTNNSIKVTRLAVNEIPHSGTKDQLLAAQGINADSIAGAVKQLI